MDTAIDRFGGQRAEWLDLSTGINRRAYPLPAVDTEHWRALPTQAEQAALIEAARTAYGLNAAGVALSGAQAAIGLIPHLAPKGRAVVLSPTYNEHAAAFRSAGWRVETPGDLAGLEGADVAVVVNPNNPDGRTLPPAKLSALSRRVGLLVVDESFTDIFPSAGVSPTDPKSGDVIVLRSFGKFFGLAGLRLGFAFSTPELVRRIAEIAGPWPVSGPAIAVGTTALRDLDWQDAMRRQLTADAARLDDLARTAGLSPVGGTPLFRLLEMDSATAVQEGLARHHVWSRVFPYNPRWLRLGLPGAEAEWQHLSRALDGITV